MGMDLIQGSLVSLAHSEAECSGQATQTAPDSINVVAEIWGGFSTFFFFKS